MYALSLLTLIAASQGIVLALVLFTQPYGFRIANQILAVFIMVHSIRLAVYHVIYANLLQKYPYIILFMNLNIALGPLLYCYIKALTDPDYRWRRLDILHFFPTFAMFAYSAYLATSAEHIYLTYNWWQANEKMSYRTLGEAAFVISAFYFLCYLIAASLRLYRHKYLIEEYFSNVDGKQLNWLWLVIAWCVLIALTTFVEQIIRTYSGFSMGQRQVYVAIFTSVLVYFMAFMGMRQNLIFAPRQPSSKQTELLHSSPELLPTSEVEQLELSVEPANAAQEIAQDTLPLAQAKYEKSGLKEDELQPLWDRLEQLMQQQKPYLDAELKLADLAEAMGLSANYLSQVINRGGGQKFFDYINIYRVKEATELLKLKPNDSLLIIALDAGFISQQAFSARFKKIMQQTPSQYRKSLRQ